MIRFVIKDLLIHMKYLLDLKRRTMYQMELYLWDKL